jgi:hypothetical protein
LVVLVEGTSSTNFENTLHFEPVGCNKLRVRKVISRRHALKVMFVRGSGRSITRTLIFFERIAEERALQ